MLRRQALGIRGQAPSVGFAAIIAFNNAGTGRATGTLARRQNDDKALYEVLANGGDQEQKTQGVRQEAGQEEKEAGDQEQGAIQHRQGR